MRLANSACRQLLAAAVLALLLSPPAYLAEPQGDGECGIRKIHRRRASGRHGDWIWPLRYIPRRWTAVSGDPPRETLGSTPLTLAESEGKRFHYPQPIPPRGRWHFTLWPTYFGVSTRSGWHFRIGIRYDDVDGYYNWPSLTIKKLPIAKPPLTRRACVPVRDDRRSSSIPPSDF
jgi:hypothetical protein